MFRLLSVVVALLTTVSLVTGQVPRSSPVAQFIPGPGEPPIPTPATPASPARSAAPGTAAPGAPAAASLPGAASDTVTLQYPNSDVGDVLRLYESLTGKKLVMDNTVQGKVNMFIARPVPRDEAIRIIEMNLLMNGFSLVPAGGDIVKVIGAGKSPRTAGVPIISDENDIPAGDQVISFLFKLRFADPIELQQVLQQYLSPPQAYTSFLALPKSSAVLVTENSSVIRGLASIINQVDIPPAEVVSEFIKLERADASKVVDMLKEVFEKGNQPNGQPGGVGVRNVRPGVPMPPPVPGQPQGEGENLTSLTALSEDSVVVGKIKMSADVRTNRIHVITRPINMPFVRKLIGEFDANVEFAKPVTRPLRYVSAADVLPVLVQSLTEPGANEGAQGAGANPAPNSPQQQQLQRRPSSTASNTNSDFGGSSGGGGGLNVSEELSTQAVDTTPKAVTIGNAKIIADQRSNSIIVLGNREVVVKVTKILDEMDVSSPQVALSTVIGELGLSGTEEFGVDYFGRHNQFSAAGTTNFTGIPPARTGATTTTNNGTTTTTGGTIFDPANLIGFSQIASSAAGGANVYLAAGSAFAAVVHALELSGNFRTISRPTVYTSNNKKAIIASGQEIPIPVNSYSQPTSTLGITTGNTFANSSSVEYKKVALQLEVVPLINSERNVSLDILQKLDSLGDPTLVNGNSIPTIQTRYIKTNVSVPNCSTIVLGGLIQTDKRASNTGLPILGRLPVVGALFRESQKKKTRSELLVLMRPEVTLTKADVQRLRQKHESRSHFGPEIDQDDCPDCPKATSGGDSKDIEASKDIMTAPDLPPTDYHP